MGRKFIWKELEQIVSDYNCNYKLLGEYIGEDNNRRLIIEDINGFKYDCYMGILKRKGKIKLNIVDKNNPYSLENISLWIKLYGKNFKLCENNIYKGNKEYLDFYCYYCKNYFKSKWEFILRNYSCPICAGKQVVENNSLAYIRPEISREWIESEHNLTPEEVTEFSGEKVLWRCNDCKNEWYCSVDNRTKNNSGCPECASSKGEKCIADILTNNNIVFIPQYKFDNCLGIKFIKRKLPFDFYLPNYNLCIEYDGILHYKIARWFDKEKAEKKLAECKINDNIKNKYCKDNNINLLRIPYWEFDNIEKILTEYLNL